MVGSISNTPAKNGWVHRQKQTDTTDMSTRLLGVSTIMGVTQNFEIVLTNSGSVFFPGQALEGHVLLDISENMKMKAIFITCTCKSEVFWNVSNQRYNRKENYLNLRLILFGNESRDADSVILAAGKHVFPFQFLLPPNLPASYEGDQGCYVRHSLKAIVERPWRSNKEFITVRSTSVLDLNAIPAATEPVLRSASDTPCFGCCGGAVTASFKLDKTGFVPGEAISIYGEVKDGANVGISSTSVILVSKSIYHISEFNFKREHTTRVDALRHEGVRSGVTDVWDGETIRIPPLPPSYLAGCNLIDIEYFIKVDVVLGYACGHIILRLPEIIGTVPLYSTFHQNSNLSYESQHGQIITNQPQGHVFPTAPVMGASASAPAIANGDQDELPPPSYEECVFGKVNTKEEGEDYTAGNLNFAPSYAYYSNI